VDNPANTANGLTGRRDRSVAVLSLRTEPFYNETSTSIRVETLKQRQFPHLYADPL